MVVPSPPTGGLCQHIAGPCLDRYITGQVLAAIAPAALQVSLTAAEAAQAERGTLDKIWRQRVERARYAADRARRQYQLAEPENRLVVRQLEKDWDAALAEADRLEGDYRRFAAERPAVLSAAERDAIRALAADIPALWNAPTTTDMDRKQIIRTVIDKITVAVAGNSELVNVTITWAGGHDTTGQAFRPVARLDQLSYYPRILALVTELTAAGHSSAQIAQALNDQGLRPPKRTDRFGSGQITTLARRLGLRVQHPRGTRTALTGLGPDRWSVAEIAVMLEMPTATVYNWIYRGWITARRAPGTRNYWIIEADAAELQRLRERRARPPVRAENFVHGSDQRGCSSGRPAVMITDYVPAVRVPPDHAGRSVAPAVPREDAWKIAEILILRHQLTVLQRQRPRRPRLNWADRALLAALLGVIPKARRRGLRLLVTPDTIVRWHRDIVRRL